MKKFHLFHWTDIEDGNQYVLNYGHVNHCFKSIHEALVTLVCLKPWGKTTLVPRPYRGMNKWNVDRHHPRPLNDEELKLANDFFNVKLAA